jgi:glycine cleavage system regulatory protein
MAQREDVYEKFDRMLILSNEIVEEIKTRLAENPNIVEEVENQWLYEIIINLPDDVRIDYLKDKLKKFDDLINTQWKNKQQ